MTQQKQKKGKRSDQRPARARYWGRCRLAMSKLRALIRSGDSVEKALKYWPACRTRRGGDHRGMRIVVTGSRGYIGSALVKALRRRFRSAEILALDVKNCKAEDICGHLALARVRGFRPHMIFNFAGVSGKEGSARTDREALRMINGYAPGNLRDAAPEALFVQAGTCSSYEETDPSGYSESKRLAEEVLQESHSWGGAGDLVLLRLGTLVGYCRTDSMRWDLPAHRMILNAVTKGAISIPKETLWRPWLPLCELLEQCLRLVECRLDCAPQYHTFPIPLASVNLILADMAQLVASSTGAVVKETAGHKDLRSYAVPALAGGHDAEHFVQVLAAVIRFAKKV